MRRYRSTIIALAIMVLGSFFLAITDPFAPSSEGQGGPPSAEVRVVNSTAEPVPVTVSDAQAGETFQLGASFLTYGRRTGPNILIPPGVTGASITDIHMLLMSGGDRRLASDSRATLRIGFTDDRNRFIGIVNFIVRNTLTLSLRTPVRIELPESADTLGARAIFNVGGLGDADAYDIIVTGRWLR